MQVSISWFFFWCGKLCQTHLRQLIGTYPFNFQQLSLNFCHDFIWRDQIMDRNDVIFCSFILYVGTKFIDHLCVSEIN